MKQYIKEAWSYHHAFLFFLCMTTCLSLILCKKLLNLPKKMFQCLGSMRKNFIPGNFSWRVAAKTWDTSCFKKGLLEKRQSVPNTCAILPLKRNFIRTLQMHFLNTSKVYQVSYSKNTLYTSIYYAVLIFTAKLGDQPHPHPHPPTI